MFGRLKSLVTPAAPPVHQTWPAEIFVELAAGWQSGMPPNAAGTALDSVRDDPECVATAYDSTRADQAVVPILRVQSKAVDLPEPEHDAWLDATADMFRTHMDPTVEADVVRTVERITIPAGEAIRVEIGPRREPESPTEAVQVQYYVPTEGGPMALWFACDPRDLEGCGDAFEQMAGTFLHLQR